jgi:hypothetical protein
MKCGSKFGGLECVRQHGHDADHRSSPSFVEWDDMLADRKLIWHRFNQPGQEDC